ncbi:hypothetical protein [Streptomyces vinaceus]|uniref:hypothetical protein n=1 Tax=Streptomyces vinaceus TaxID=1960 RepID=UPI00381F7DB5
MPRTRRRTALPPAAPSLCTPPLIRSAPRAEAAGVRALCDTVLTATAPEWPAAATVSVYTATPCGQFTHPLPYTHLD